MDEIEFWDYWTSLGRAVRIAALHKSAPARREVSNTAARIERATMPRVTTPAGAVCGFGRAEP